MPTTTTSPYIVGMAVLTTQLYKKESGLNGAPHTMRSTGGMMLTLVAGAESQKHPPAPMEVQSLHHYTPHR